MRTAITKSLHSVTSLVRVARAVRTKRDKRNAEALVIRALKILDPPGWHTCSDTDPVYAAAIK